MFVERIHILYVVYTAMNWKFDILQGKFTLMQIELPSQLRIVQSHSSAGLFSDRLAFQVGWDTPHHPPYTASVQALLPITFGTEICISINHSINSIRVHHATEALGHNIVQNSIMTT